MSKFPKLFLHNSLRPNNILISSKIAGIGPNTDTKIGAILVVIWHDT